MTVTVLVNGQGAELGQRVHLHWSANGEQCVPNNGPTGGRDGGNHHGDELRYGRDGDVRRHGSDQRGGGEQHDHHGDHTGACGGAVTVTVTNLGGLSGSLANGFTYNTHGGDQLRAGGRGHAANADGDGECELPGSADGRGSERGGGGVERYGTSTVQSVTDSAGNSYSLAIGPTSGTGLQQSIYYAANIAGGSNTVTVTFSQAAAYPDVRILEYRGVTALDVTAGASGSSASASSGTATTTSANELIFGANTVATGNEAAGSGFTSRIITTPDGDLAEDKIGDGGREQQCDGDVERPRGRG